MLMDKLREQRGKRKKKGDEEKYYACDSSPKLLSTL